MANLSVIQGDITKQHVDAIVNAANTSLLGGGGVDGAIHRAAGTQLLDECRTLNGCNVGEAKITAGYNLRAKHVIHTVGPVWHGGNDGEADLLYNAYYNSLLLAQEQNLKTIAFPNISTGVYHFPRDKAAAIALKAVNDFLDRNPYVIHDIVFVCFDEENFDIYNKMLQ